MWLLLTVVGLAAGSVPACGSQKGSPGRQVLFETGFEDTPPGRWPAEWLTTGGRWQVAGTRNHAARQADPKLMGGALASLTWVNYNLRATATCLRHQEQWGMGVFAYWQDAHNYYRLSTFGDRLQLVRCLNGVTEVLDSRPLRVPVNTSWKFRLTLLGEGERVLLRGRVWPANAPEPVAWQVQAYDFSTLRRGGAAGVWCAKAQCQFDDVVIRPTRPPSNTGKEGRFHADFDSGTPGQPPAGWFPLGGKWRLRGKKNLVLEQSEDRTPFTFDANAFCLIAEWTNYTVSARLRCLTGRETWGFGIAGYYQNPRNHYRLYAVGDTLFLARRATDSGTALLAQIPFPVQENTDYVFQLQLQSDDGKTALRGKAWPADRAEPDGWMVQAEDRSTERFTAGAVALLALDAACEFDEVRVVKD